MSQKRVILSALSAGSLALGGAAHAQSINVDLAVDARSHGAGVPLPTFGGAAGQPGFWSLMDTSLDGPVGVIGLDGVSTSISMFLQGPDYVAVLDDPGTEGSTAALLDDSICGFGDVVGGIQLRGLRPGKYRAVVYGFAGGQPDQLTLLMVGNQGAVTGGAWSGEFEEGVTHATFHVEVPDGELNIQAAGGIWGQSGYMNGFQLTMLGEHGCDADLNHDGYLDHGDVGVFIHLFLAQDPAADLNRDGFIDSGDIAEFIRMYLGGC